MYSSGSDISISGKEPYAITPILAEIFTAPSTGSKSSFNDSLLSLSPPAISSKTATASYPPLTWRNPVGFASAFLNHLPAFAHGRKPLHEVDKKAYGF
jgi:hypothetical protein